MIERNGIWFPDWDEHFGMRQSGCTDVTEYQVDKYKRGLKICKRRRTAIDVGAHVGLWTLRMARHFDEVVAIEANPENVACLRRNVAHLGNVRIVHAAAWNWTNQTLHVEGRDHGKNNTGDIQVRTDGVGTSVFTQKIDHLRVQDVDFLKLDIQGSELKALSGAVKTLQAYGPTVLLEDEKPEKLRQLHAKEGEVTKWLFDRGGFREWKRNRDHCFTFPNGFKPFTKYVRKGAYHWAQYDDGKLKPLVDRVVSLIAGLDMSNRTGIDLGCGDGLYAAKLKEADSPIDVMAYDRDRTAVKLALEFGVEAEVEHAHNVAPVKADFLLLADTLEHVPWPMELLKRWQDHVRWLVVVNPRPSKRYGQDHVQEWSPGELVEEISRSTRFRKEFSETVVVSSRNTKDILVFEARG